MKFLEMIVMMVLAISLSYIVGKYDYFPTMIRNLSATKYDYFVFAQQSPFVYCIRNRYCKDERPRSMACGQATSRDITELAVV
ncbi:hypothetical protein ACE6H2_028299 [Prunus campanulata]